MGGRRQVVTSPEAAFPPQWRWGYQKDFVGRGYVPKSFFLEGEAKKYW